MRRRRCGGVLAALACAWLVLLALFTLSGGFAARREPGEPARALEAPFTPAGPPGAGALAPLPAGVELVWTRPAGAPALGEDLAAALPERDLAAEAPAKTCAVVGSSGALLRSGYGPFIDAHEQVFRFNGAPAGGGWSSDAGAKTTISVLADVQTRLCTAGGATRAELIPAGAGGAEPERVERPVAGCDFYGGGTILFIPRRDGAAQLLRYARARAKTGGPRVLVRADSFARYVDAQLPAYTADTSHPTSGFNGVLAALALCGALDLYGFGSPREHYFSKPRAERAGAQHLYRSEHAWFVGLERRFPGRVRVWR